MRATHVSAHRAATHPSTPSLASGPRPPQCPPLPAPMCQPESAARPNAGGRTAGQVQECDLNCTCCSQSLRALPPFSSRLRSTVGARADGWQVRRRLHRTYTGRHLHPAHAASPWPAVRHMTSPKRTRSGDLMPSEHTRTAHRACHRAPSCVHPRLHTSCRKPPRAKPPASRLCPRPVSPSPAPTASVCAWGY